MKQNFKLLVVDDDQLIADSIKMLLPKNWSMQWARDPRLVSNKLSINAAFVDMHYTPDHSLAEGPTVIRSIHQQNPQIEIVAMSGDLSLELMEQCLAAGARKYIAKPLNPKEIISTLEKIEALWMIRQLEHQNHTDVWIGSSPAAEKVKTQIAQLRGESGPILIEGETGTGKEVTFRLLNHQEIGRHYIAVNIASIPENLFESEMYGHTKGAFTGADAMKVGLAEAAHGGDLFLDEIEAIPLSQQVKLLRFLETGEVRKVGAKESSIVQCRVILASNQNLEGLAKEGKFREDLLFRINGKKIKLPPMRDRIEDLEELLNYFMLKDRGLKLKQFTKESIELLKKYSWPGNIREVKRVCEQVMVTTPLPVIRPIDLMPLLRIEGSEMKLDLEQGLEALMESYEIDVIKKALLICKSDVDKTANLLKVSKSNLYKKIKDYQIVTE